MTCYHCLQPGHMRRDWPRRQRSIQSSRICRVRLLLHLLTRVAFKLDASYSFIVASCVMDLDLEVKAFREATHRCSSLGCRVRVDLIGRDYE